MNKYAKSNRLTAPTVFVTKGKQRVKQFDNNIVYLKNGDEFELEFFNPTNEKVLAKIKINGSSIGSGLIMRPGERVFLERYMDEARKFLFETYEVDGSDSNVKEAIKNNGVVEVEFFKEYHKPSYDWYEKPKPWTITIPQPAIWIYHSHAGNYVNPPSTANPTYYYNNTITCGNTAYTTGTSRGADNITYTANANSIKSAKSDLKGLYENYENYAADINQVDAFLCMDNAMETGRVEKGSHSDQHFIYDNTEFNTYCTWRAEWKILPLSVKPLMKEDLSVYCTNCGAKRKKETHKFCPNCGTKF